MKKSFKYALAVFITIVSSVVISKKVTAQQHTPPSAYNSNIPVNFVRTWDATAPEQDPNALMTRQLLYLYLNVSHKKNIKLINE